MNVVLFVDSRWTDMSAIPSNVSQLDPFLQRLNRQIITLKEEEVKEANLNLQNVSSKKER